MDNTFPIDEKLYRAVFPATKFPNFWKTNGKVSSAAFKDKRGLSVERGNYRDDNEVVSMMRKFFQGHIIAVTVADCADANAVVKYCPSERSEYHSEIHSSNGVVLLTNQQCKLLADRAITISREDLS